MLNNFYSSQLGSGEQVAYRTIRTTILNRSPRYTVYDLSPDSVDRAWRAAVMETLDPAYAGLINRTAQSGRTITGTLEYAPVDRALFDAKYEALLAKIDSKLTSRSSDYAVCKAIYDVLASTVRYQDRVLNRFLTLKRENSAELPAFLARNFGAFTPYGAVVRSEGVCQGISKLFKLLCNRFGIECACAEATRIEGGGTEADHMLNVVEIDGVRSFVDVTNGLYMKDFPVVRYDYFLVSAAVIGKAYRVPAAFGECADERNNYFVRNHLRFSDLNKLRTYLAAYTAYPENGEVRAEYTGKMSERDLSRLFGGVIEDHCPEGKRAVHAVKNGFCTAKIMDNEEV